MTLLTPSKVAFLLQCFRETLKLNLHPNVIEVGVYRGGSLDLLMREAHFASMARNFFGFDTFEGLPAPRADKDGDQVRGEHTCPLDHVREFLPRAIFKKGYFPDCLSEHDPKEWSFAHLDIDLYEGTKSAIEVLWKGLVPGGVIVCDDYKFSRTPGVTEAINEFMERHSLAPHGVAPHGQIAFKRGE